MPFCPTCRSEYVLTVERCPHCDVALVAELTKDSLEERRDQLASAVRDGTALVVSQGSFDAASELADSLLVWKIAAQVAKPPGTECDDEQGPCTHYKVMILEEDEPAAATALHNQYRDLVAREGTGAQLADAPADACPACGTAVPENATECPDCGLAFG
jgi:hypothetical protein